MTTLDQAKTHSSTRGRDFAPGGLGFDWIITVLIMVATAGVGLELVGVVSFTLLALAGLWASPWFIVVGLVLHGVWDVLHHNGWDVVKTKIPQGYIPFCAGYDWLLALILGVRLSF